MIIISVRIYQQKLVNYFETLYQYLLAQLAYIKVKLKMVKYCPSCHELAFTYDVKKGRYQCSICHTFSHEEEAITPPQKEAQQWVCRKQNGKAVFKTKGSIKANCEEEITLINKLFAMGIKPQNITMFEGTHGGYGNNFNVSRCYDYSFFEKARKIFAPMGIEVKTADYRKCPSSSRQFIVFGWCHSAQEADVCPSCGFRNYFLIEDQGKYTCQTVNCGHSGY